jgi:hypothetical protein
MPKRCCNGLDIGPICSHLHNLVYLICADFDGTINETNADSSDFEQDGVLRAA